MCGTWKIIPKSCMLSDSFLVVSLPSTPGQAYEGTFGGSKVRVQRIKLNSGVVSLKLEEVCPRRYAFSALSVYGAPRRL